MKEIELHKQIIELFDKLGIFYIRSRTDKRTTQKKGIPDFLFAYYGQAVAWEVKVDDNKLSKEQIEVCGDMRCSPNQWEWFEIRSLDDAIKAMNEL